MISVILILNGRGRVLISRSFRKDVDARTIAQAFRNRVVHTKSSHAEPVINVDGVSFMYVRLENLYIIACTKKNVNATLCFQFLHRMVDLFKAYFKGKFGEATIQENFALIYELIDEVLDYGYPQNCNPDILKTYISGKNLPPKTAYEMEKISKNVTGKVNWRVEGIVHPRNEVFLDVIESVNILMSKKGNVLNSEVIGKIVMKAYLSGMPECKLGLNDKLMMGPNAHQNALKRNYKPVDIDDIKFHQCVKLGKFDSDRTICFVPLDGEFEVMSYRITDGIIAPFRLIAPVVQEVGKTQLNVQVNIRSNFPEKRQAKNVIVRIPMPNNVAKAKIKTSKGKAKYIPEENAIIWRFKKFGGNRIEDIKATCSLLAQTDQRQQWSKPPISIKFDVPMFAASQIYVRFLKIIEQKLNYSAIKWVRYITKAGSYEQRI